MQKLFLLLALTAALALAQQTDTNVTLSAQPPVTGMQFVYGYSASQLQYTCSAPAQTSTGNRWLTHYPISAASNASAVVFTTTASINLNSRPQVTIAGATGNWTPVNGTFTATILSSTTFSIPVNSSGFSTLTGTLYFQSTAPVLNQPVWAVQEYFYDTSGDLISSMWLGGSTGYKAKCTDATSTTLNVQ